MKEEQVAQIQKSYNSREKKEKVLKEAPPEEKEKKHSLKENNETSKDKEILNQIEQNMVKNLRNSS